MESKQTAVEWLFDKLLEEGPSGELRWHLKYDIFKILEQAKAMEKEQIMDAHNQGYADGYRDNGKFPIEYYTETYGAQTPKILHDPQSRGHLGC